MRIFPKVFQSVSPDAAGERGEGEGGGGRKSQEEKEEEEYISLLWGSSIMEEALMIDLGKLVFDLSSAIA